MNMTKERHVPPLLGSPINFKKASKYLLAEHIRNRKFEEIYVRNFLCPKIPVQSGVERGYGF